MDKVPVTDFNDAQAKLFVFAAVLHATFEVPFCTDPLLRSLYARSARWGEKTLG